MTRLYWIIILLSTLTWAEDDYTISPDGYSPYTLAEATTLTCVECDTVLPFISSSYTALYQVMYDGLNPNYGFLPEIDALGAELAWSQFIHSYSISRHCSPVPSSNRIRRINEDNELDRRWNLALDLINENSADIIHTIMRMDGYEYYIFPLGEGNQYNGRNFLIAKRPFEGGELEFEYFNLSDYYPLGSKEQRISEYIHANLVRRYSQVPEMEEESDFEIRRHDLAVSDQTGSFLFGLRQDTLGDTALPASGPQLYLYYNDHIMGDLTIEDKIKLGFSVDANTQNPLSFNAGMTVNPFGAIRGDVLSARAGVNYNCMFSVNLTGNHNSVMLMFDASQFVRSPLVTTRDCESRPIGNRRSQTEQSLRGE